MARVVSVAALLSATSSLAGAQQQLLELRDSVVAIRCQQDAKAVSSAKTNVSSAAIKTLRNCARTGPPALAVAWNQSWRDTSTMSALIYSSLESADRRLISQLVKVATDANRSFSDRAAAIGVLGHYLQPKAMVSFGKEVDANGRPIPALRWGFHELPATGEEQATVQDKSHIMTVLTAIASTERDIELRSMAQLLVAK